ncbi:hypothetical protein QAD02_020376 [Eretmocerus hayati]|uniref:Uncharacterized protein n=1 Tax=Eretmocerus hayati TaxID=131215 RepID=A0ACC2PMR0_9HYME|nr:hypothetical protein QAD02_020376 [Eretmocerus hayati]
MMMRERGERFQPRSREHRRTNFYSGLECGRKSLDPTQTLECGCEQGGAALPPAGWNADAAVAQPLGIGMRTQVPGPHRHWNANVNKEGGPATVILECGSHWNAEAIGMRTGLMGRPSRLMLEYGCSCMGWLGHLRLECGCSCIGRLSHLRLECGCSCIG